jgi:hypothetical protein
MSGFKRKVSAPATMEAPAKEVQLEQRTKALVKTNPGLIV